MAEAPYNTEFEGKRIASHFDLCGWCETNIAVKLCEECPERLCTICVKGHQKLKYTKDHVLVDIENATTDAKPPNKSTWKGKCPQHQGENFTSMCKTCIELLCDSCVSDHNDHPLQTLHNDVKLYQTVCGKHIQKLFDGLRALEDIKSCLESHIGTYEEAIGVVDEWETDLVNMIKKRADKLRQQLKKLKDDKYKTLSDKVNGLTTKLQQVDSAIAKLSNIRKSMDVGILSTHLSESRALLDKLMSYQLELHPLPKAVTLTDVLPNGDQMKVVEDSLDIMFIEHGAKAGPQPVAAWQFTAANKGRDLSRHSENPLVLKDVQYGSGPKGEAGAVCFPALHTRQSIAVMNPSDRLRFTTEMSFFAHIYVDGSNTGPLFENYSDRGVLGCHTWVNPDIKSLHFSETGCSATAREVLTPKTWHKVAFVRDTSTASIYVDGQLVNSQTAKIDLSKTQAGHIYIGCTPRCNYRITGRLASAKFYNVALSEKEIKDL